MSRVRAGYRIGAPGAVVAETDGFVRTDAAVDFAPRPDGSAVKGLIT